MQLLDDTPVVPGDARPAYDGSQQARQVLNDAEDDLRDWRPEVDDYDTAEAPVAAAKEKIADDEVASKDEDAAPAVEVKAAA